MRIRVIRIIRDGFEHFFFRRFLPAFLAGGDTKVIVRRRAFRIDRQCLGQFCEGVVELGLPIIDDAERGTGEFILRRDRDRFFQGQLRSF